MFHQSILPELEPQRSCKATLTYTNIPHDTTHVCRHNWRDVCRCTAPRPPTFMLWWGTVCWLSFLNLYSTDGVLLNKTNVAHSLAIARFKDIYFANAPSRTPSHLSRTAVLEEYKTLWQNKRNRGQRRNIYYVRLNSRAISASRAIIIISLSIIAIAISQLHYRRAVKTYYHKLCLANG